MAQDVIFTGKARADLDDIFWFIANDNPRRARLYVADIEEECNRLAEMPRKGVLRPEFGDGIHTFPLWKRIVVVYELSADTVTVLRVFSAGRDYEAIMRGV